MAANPRPAIGPQGQDFDSHLAGGELDAIRIALESMETGVTVLDATGRLTYANDAAAGLVGYDRASDLIGATAAGAMARFELVGVDGEPFPLERLPSRLALGGCSAQAVIRFRPRGGASDRWSSVRSVPVLDASGKVARVVTFFDDVTTQQQEEIHRQLLLRAADELNSSLDYEKTLAAVAHLAVPTLADWCAVDLLDGDRIKRVATAHVDPAKLALVGEIHGRWPASRFSSGGSQVIRTGKPQLVAKISPDMLAAAALDDAQLQVIEQLKLCSYMGVPLKAYGKTIGSLIFAMAESGRHYTDLELRAAEALASRASMAIENARSYQEVDRLRNSTQESFRLMVETVKDYAIFRLDPRGIVSTWNAGAQLIKGYRAEEIIGSHFSRFYRAEEVRSGKCELELESAAREGRFEDEGWRVRKDGSEFWANVVITAIVDAEGRLSGFVKVTRDLTERRRTEAERAARLAAEQSSRAKDEFLALLGHELRNPLAPIVTALDLIRLHGNTDSKEHQVIERQVRHMTRLVDDLLDVSRIVMGKVALVRRVVDLRAVLARSVEMASPLLEQRQQHFDLRFPPEEVSVDGDEERLSQVFSNLITNAAKYTAVGGHIVVSLERAGQQARVEVRDDGVGISKEMLPRVFDLFVQAQQTGERSSGLGIGLSVVRSLLEMHGGTVTAESAGPGCGSTFAVELPAVSEQRAAPPPLPHQALIRADQRKRVLLVDDNEDALELTAELLREVGHTVATALEGPSALQLLTDFRAEVAVIDIGLPVMDGYELATQIRARLGPAAPLLIALSGYAQERDRARSSEAGFRLHLVKPVDAEALLEAISTLS